MPQKITFTRQVTYYYEYSFADFAETIKKKKPHADVKDIKDIWGRLLTEGKGFLNAIDAYDFEVRDVDASSRTIELEPNEDGWIEDEDGSRFYGVDEMAEECANFIKFKFKIEEATKTLICPDGSRKAFNEDTQTGEVNDRKTYAELYAEWKDIGVFYYPTGNDRKEEGEPDFWVQGQRPTYHGETLDDEVEVEFI